MDKLSILAKTQIMLLGIICISLSNCQINRNSSDKYARTSLNVELPSRPNILWLVAEDLGPYIPPFGDSTIKTPNLSHLAAEGVRYANTFSTSGVCAPSRAAIATGMYPTSIGANHMRTGNSDEENGRPGYEAIPPHYVKMVSELLRVNGYYCSNNPKEDYQFNAPVTAWNESSYYAHWRNREDNQPFFAVFNFGQTHESGLFEPYGFQRSKNQFYNSGDTSVPLLNGTMPENETAINLQKDTKFPIPPYLPDNEVVRRDLWKMYNNIAEMDKQLGAILKQLEDDGLLENTIIFFYGDNAGPMPRQKRLIYDSGLKVPMIIRYPNKKCAGAIDSQLVSFVDFAPTLLSLAGITPPEYLQGQAFLGEFKAKDERKYIYGAVDRLDEYTDAIRAVRDKQFQYIRNYKPEQGYYQPLKYREQIPTMQEMLRLRDEGKLDSIQSLWFRNKKEPEELYDCQADPHQVHNLANNPAYNVKLNELRQELDRWLVSINDQPTLSEKELLNKLWEGKESAPITATPIIDFSNGKTSITCTTKGASIAYKIINSKLEDPKSWSVYQEPFVTAKGAIILVQAHRIGFRPSDIITYELTE